MQPYAYVAYPNPNGRTVPVHYMAPANYQQSFPPFANQYFDSYATMPPPVHPIQYVQQPLPYPPGAVSLGYRPGLPPPRMTMVPPRQLQVQHPQGYSYNSNGVNPAVPSKSKQPAVTSKDARNNAIKALVSNKDIDDLLKHNGTKVKVSRIYRITKIKHSSKENDSSDDEYKQVPLDSARAQTIKRSSIQFQRPLPAISSCSHGSICSNCSCSEYCSQNQEHGYDNCLQCRAEREHEQTNREKRK